MPYDYVRRTYGVDPKIGGRVVHTVTAKSGTARIRRQLHASIPSSPQAQREVR